MAFSTASPILVKTELETAGAYLNNQAGMISDELNQLASYINALPADWQGNASTYYQGLQHEWNVAAMNLFGPDGVLGQISRALNLTWNNYADAESANSTTWNHG